MNRTPLLLFALILMGCAPKSWLHQSVQNGVEVNYRWNHPKTGGSELLLVMRNTTAVDRSIALGIDLYLQGLTVETMVADTCIGGGRTLNAKVNGIYFVPEKVSTEQIKSGAVQVELTQVEVEATETCLERSNEADR